MKAICLTYNNIEKLHVFVEAKTNDEAIIKTQGMFGHGTNLKWLSTRSAKHSIEKIGKAKLEKMKTICVSNECGEKLYILVQANTNEEANLKTRLLFGHKNDFTWLSCASAKHAINKVEKRR